MSALRKLPLARMFEDFDDGMLIEVVLLDFIVCDRNTKAVVLFIPHGDPCKVDTVDFEPVMVPGHWFSQLMPLSIFLDIPEDASALSPVWDPQEDGPGTPVESVKPGAGEELAVRWRANKRPIATTKDYFTQCYPHAPAHLLNIGLDAIEALASGRFTKASRGRIATFCELMSRHLSSLDSPTDQPE